MKKLVTLVVLAALWLPCYSISPEEEAPMPALPQEDEVVDSLVTENTWEDAEYAQYHALANLWRDLARWDSLTASEYAWYCNRDSFPYLSYDEYGELEFQMGSLEAASYMRPVSYTDYIDIFDAHARITKRLYGANTPAYIEAASKYVEALREFNCVYTEVNNGATDTLQCLERALAVCNEVIPLPALERGSKAYYEWRLTEFGSRLSKDGPSRKLYRQIAKRAKGVQAINDTTLVNEYMQMQVECALMQHDYARALDVLQERMQTLPPLPANWDEDDYAPIAYMLYEPCVRLYVVTYVLKGDFENARRYLNLEGRILFDMPALTADTPADEVAKNMIELCSTWYAWGNSYRWGLQQLFEQKIFEWSGYRKEDNY